MKKLILVVMVSVAGYALNAQVTAVYTVQSTGSGNTIIAPEPILTNFQTAYPTATMVMWEPMNGGWYASYKEDDYRMTRVFYSTQPYYLVPVPGRDVNFKVALPVSNTYVPDVVIAAAVNSYGASLYSITTIKAANGDVVYQVCLLENGNARTVWMNPGGTAFTSVDKMRAGDLKDKLNDNK